MLLEKDGKGVVATSFFILRGRAAGIKVVGHPAQKVSRLLCRMPISVIGAAALETLVKRRMLHGYPAVYWWREFMGK